MCQLLFLVTTACRSNNTCCSLILSLLTVCYNLQGSRYIHTVCMWCWQESNINGVVVWAWYFTTQLWGYSGEKTKPSSFKLMISSDFSKACSAGKGPHTSLSFHYRRCFCWGSIIFYSWLWNLFQLSQITLLSSHYSLHFHNIHTPHI